MISGDQSALLRANAHLNTSRLSILTRRKLTGTQTNQIIKHEATFLWSSHFILCIYISKMYATNWTLNLRAQTCVCSFFNAKA
uniref:Uncharacterized protein n=1 Tax=Arundo donax TaxID=35708 RepID=A0A0A9H846_ARUDO